MCVSKDVDVSSWTLMWCISAWFLILSDGDGLLGPDCIPPFLLHPPFFNPLVCRTVEVRILASEIT